jgi:hypothetical protein
MCPSVGTDVSEEHIASMFRVEEQEKLVTNRSKQEDDLEDGRDILF